MSPGLEVVFLALCIGAIGGFASPFLPAGLRPALIGFAMTLVATAAAVHIYAVIHFHIPLLDFSSIPMGLLITIVPSAIAFALCRPVGAASRRGSWRSVAVALGLVGAAIGALVAQGVRLWAAAAVLFVAMLGVLFLYHVNRALNTPLFRTRRRARASDPES